MSYPELDRLPEHDNLEIWIDESVPYILYLIKVHHGLYKVIDPQDSFRVIFSANSYDEAMFWLAEDEYVRQDIE